MLLEKKRWLKIGSGMHSNINYLCGWSVVGIAWAGFQLADSIYVLKARGEYYITWIDSQWLKLLAGCSCPNYGVYGSDTGLKNSLDMVL